MGFAALLEDGHVLRHLFFAQGIQEDQQHQHDDISQRGRAGDDVVDAVHGALALHRRGLAGSRADIADGAQGEAADAAGQLVDCTGRLFVVGFDLGEYVSETGSESVSITFSSGAELICRAQTQAALPTSEPAAESGQEPAPEPLPPSSGQASGSPPGNMCFAFGRRKTRSMPWIFPSPWWMAHIPCRS